MKRILMLLSAGLLATGLASCNRGQQLEFEKIRNRIEALEILLAEQKAALKEHDILQPELEKIRKEFREERARSEALQTRCLLLDAELEAIKKRTPELASPSLPQIDAVVQAMKAQEHLVILSVGKDAGAQEGYQFTIYRGNKFIGKIKVIKVYQDHSGAQVLWTAEGEEVKIGDKATTKL